MKKTIAALLPLMLLFSCALAEGSDLSAELGLTKESKPASSYTAQINSAVTPCWILRIPANMTMPSVG